MVVAVEGRESSFPTSLQQEYKDKGVDIWDFFETSH
jgi:hypothetical protein